jgi:hypothetical protein
MTGNIKDGYEWLGKVDLTLKRKLKFFRYILLWYFRPFMFEKFQNAKIYRILKVPAFGKFLPTGGSEIRRMTKLKMRAYTLKSLSIASLKEFLYKNCFFELLHLPFLIFMIWRSLWWFYTHNNVSVALELFLVNIIFNIYPIMYHRYTRIRVLNILRKHRQNTNKKGF